MSGKMYIYVSCWNEFVGNPGIGLLEFNPADGDLKKIDTLEDTLTCNCTAIDKEKNILYITNEIKENPDYLKGGGGLINAYKIDPETARLTQISRVPACCPCPAYISIDPSGHFLVCANHSSFFAVTKAAQKADGTWGMEVVYDDATVDLFELNGDGTIGDLVDVDKHTGRKQAFILHSHPHTAVWSPNGKFCACCDKGDDHIYMYQLDYRHKKLIRSCDPFPDAPNSMPRYCAFHPTKPFLFNNHEHDITCSAFKYDDEGHLELVNTVSSLPEDFVLPEVKGFLPGQKPGQQAFVIDAAGKYIYNIVNGAGVDGVSVFEVHPFTGAIKLVQFQRIDGKWARGCALSPDGKFLVVSCLDDDGAVISYAVGEDGTLTDTGKRASVPGGSYVTFYQGA